jgi:hypothetical protein
MNSKKFRMKNKIRIIQRVLVILPKMMSKLPALVKTPLLSDLMLKLTHSAKSLGRKNRVLKFKFLILFTNFQNGSKRLLSSEPRIKVEEATGTVKVLKIFSKVKDRQVLGGRVEKGQLLARR